MRRAAPLLRTFLSSTLLSLLLVGCQPGYKNYKLTRPDKHYSSIVSLSPSTSELVATYGQLTSLKGRTAADDYPIMIKNVPIVASVKPDYEAIQKIAPDLIVYDASLYSDQDIQKIKALHADTFVIDAKSVNDFIKELYQFADMLGTNTNMDGYVGRIQGARDQALGDKPSPTPKVAVLMPEKGSEPMIAGTKGFIADVIQIAGGQLVGPDSDKFTTANPETLVTENPDIIIIPATAATAAADVQTLLSDPKLASITAIKNKAIKALDSDVVLREGSQVDKFIKNAHLAITIKGSN